MNNFIKKYKFNLITLFIGFSGGIAYWYFVGCDSGNCAIWSVWYRSGIYGALLGWLVGDILKKQPHKKTNHE
jgi:hypothetical protein